MAISVKKELITPRKAARWLQKNNENRPLRQRYVDRLCDALKAGEFQENGETIKFNCDGGLCDGQHRLHAVVKSGVPYQGLIVRGVPREAFDTIDQGTPRQISDILARRGETNYNHLAAALRLTHYMELNDQRAVISGHKSLRGPVAVELLERYPDLRGAVAFCCANELRTVMSVGHAAALYRIAHQQAPRKADDFWSKLGTGEQISRDEPVYLLRKKLLMNRQAGPGQARMTRDQVIAFCIKAWNAHYKNKKLKILKWSEGEDFPTFAK